MHRQLLLSKLQNYHAVDAHETEMQKRITDFVKTHTDCFERTLLAGHITASALILNPLRTRTLLTHHHKLDKWLQLGGHSDGDSDSLNVALREAEEESGIANIHAVSEEIFDVDVHPIPAHKNEPEHFHYDIRFLLEADDAYPLTISNESKDLAWVALDRITDYTTEESLLRMVRKIYSPR
ncbi:MAG: NUDIX hydrolase [Bacteroidota bacterium]|nr:NUDIX hydrolase [Bacteroidota bacterium]